MKVTVIVDGLLSCVTPRHQYQLLDCGGSAARLSRLIEQGNAAAGKGLETSEILLHDRLVLESVRHGLLNRREHWVREIRQLIVHPGAGAARGDKAGAAQIRKVSGRLSGRGRT